MVQTSEDGEEISIEGGAGLASHPNWQHPAGGRGASVILEASQRCVQAPLIQLSHLEGNTLTCQTNDGKA